MSELLNPVADWHNNGKDYKLCKRDILIEGQFSDWVMREAALALARLRPHIPPEFYEAQIRLYSAKVCGKRFRWESEDVNSALWSEEGRRHMIWLKMKRGEQKGGAFIRREELEDIANDQTADENGLTRWNCLEDIFYQQDHPDFFVEYVKPVREEAVKEALMKRKTGKGPPTREFQITRPEEESPLPLTSVLSS
jgi:hypothetical protein